MRCHGVVDFVAALLDRTVGDVSASELGSRPPGVQVYRDKDETLVNCYWPDKDHAASMRLSERCKQACRRCSQRFAPHSHGVTRGVEDCVCICVKLESTVQYDGGQWALAEHNDDAKKHM